MCTKTVGETETSIRNGVGKENGEGETKENAIQAKAERTETPSQSTPDYIETRRVKKNALIRQKRKSLHLKKKKMKNTMKKRTMRKKQ